MIKIRGDLIRVIHVMGYSDIVKNESIKYIFRIPSLWFDFQRSLFWRAKVFKLDEVNAVDFCAFIKPTVCDLKVFIPSVMKFWLHHFMYGDNF